tara:strand:+ start:70 stop:540 length:471 start_codon:yes stop_codon:yes gene_type:complete
MKKFLALNFILLIFTSSCGFKVVNKSQSGNYDIAEIITSGEKRVNYRIKNKLLLKSEPSEKKLIRLNIISKTDKSIEEKNIKNEITKYKIVLTVLIKITEINNNNKEEFTISQMGYYDVASQHSLTLNNEKKLIRLLSDKVGDEILDELIFKMNDN